MKILLDECLPVDFRHSFPRHDAHTVQWAGLKGKKNGELFEAAILRELETIQPGPAGHGAGGKTQPLGGGPPVNGDTARCQFGGGLVKPLTNRPLQTRQSIKWHVTPIRA